MSLSEALSAASTLRYLTALDVSEMTYKEGGLFAQYFSPLLNLKMLRIYDSRLRLTAEDSDAICRLPSLAHLVIDVYDDEDDYSERDRLVTIASPSTDAVRALTSLVELNVPSGFMPTQVVADLGLLQRLTRL